MIILSTTRHHEGQEIEIFVKYNEKTNTVEEIKSVFLKSHGRSLPIGNFCMAISELEEAVNKIIDNTDWRLEYRDMTEIPEPDSSLLPIFEQILRPFTPHI